MGGKAFLNCDRPLNTPRLQPRLYFLTRNRYITELKTLYHNVETPIEAPGKADYGDIDILVSGPVQKKITDLGKTSPKTSKQSHTSRAAEGLLQAHGSDGKVDAPKIPLTHLEAIKTLLRPSQTLYVRQSPSLTLALPHPTLSDAHIQVDIHLCPTVAEWEWLLFLHAHGDIWNLLGTSIRPFGLTATDAGLFLRDPAIERFDRKRSMIFLTRDPAEVLDLLGYEEDEYWGTAQASGAVSGQLSEESRTGPGRRDPALPTSQSEDHQSETNGSSIIREPTEYENSKVTSSDSVQKPSRDHSGTSSHILSEDQTTSHADPVESDLEPSLFELDPRGFVSVEAMYAFATRCRFFRKSVYIRSILKANDRARMSKRDTYRRFVDEFVPNLPDTSSKSSLDDSEEHSQENGLTADTRESVFDEVLDRWGRRQEWIDRRAKWDAEREALREKLLVKETKKACEHEDMAYVNAWLLAMKVG